MKNLFFFGLIVFLSSNTLHAQEPALTRNKMMTFGSVTQLADVSESTINLIDITQTGENQLWDFSGVTNKNPDVVYTSTIERPIETPYYNDYPESNYVETEETFSNNVLINKRYSYYLLSDTQLERLGSKNSETGESSVYSNPQTEYVFPLSYGITNEDTWNSTSSFLTGYANLECIGSGTLKLPNGVYENVLMVHIEIDNIFIVLDNYFWLSENGALLTAYYAISSIFSSNPEINAMYATNTDIISSGLESVKSIVNNIQYNNPVQHTLELKMETNGVSDRFGLSISNTHGATVLASEFSSFSSENSAVNLDLSSLNPGIYFLSINSISNPSLKPEIIKIIKQ